MPSAFRLLTPLYAVLFYLAGHYLNQSRWQWLSGAAPSRALVFKALYFGWMHDAPVLYRLIISLLQISTIDTAIAIGEQVSKPRDIEDIPDRVSMAI